MVIQFSKQHLEHGPQNAQYTASNQRLIQSLRSSPYFTILADECEDITTMEELSICGQWVVNGKPEEHFLIVLHGSRC